MNTYEELVMNVIYAKDYSEAFSNFKKLLSEVSDYDLSDMSDKELAIMLKALGEAFIEMSTAVLEENDCDTEMN